MFWSKYRSSGEPSTPKLKSISLPDDTPIKRVLTPQWHSEPEKIKDISPPPDAGRTSKTPHPPSARYYPEKAGEAKRSRTTSLSSRFVDGPLKSEKIASIDEDFIKPVASAPSFGGYDRDQADYRTAPPPKSILKGSSHHTTSMKHSDTIPPHAGHTGKYGAPPPVHPSMFIQSRHAMQPSIHPSTYPGYGGRQDVLPMGHHQISGYNHRSRNQSFSGHEPYAAPVTSRYVKPHVTKVPQKEEAISLSWPLVEYTSRSRMRPPKPLLYFDIGFDPRNDIRIKRHDSPYTLPTEEELGIPASSHCELTEMDLLGPGHLSRWPIKIRRSQGIRCIDVFDEIYATFEKPLTRRDLDDIERRDPNYIDRCFPAFKQRCKDSPGLTLYNEKCGMRRVDLLKGSRIFKGLLRDSETATWTLQIHKPLPVSP